MSIRDKFTEKRRRDGLDKGKFYACRMCYGVVESYDLIDTCQSCTWKGDFIEASSKELIDRAIDAVKNPKKTTETPPDDQMKNFIFDPDEIYSRVAFPLFQTRGGIGVGLYLTEWRNVYDKAGNQTGLEQIDVPVVVTDNRQLLRIKAYGTQPTLEPLRIRFFTLPAEMDLRWSLPSLHAYLDGAVDEVTPRKIFEDIKNAYAEYLYFAREEWYTTHALWDIGTYFCQLFPAFPYLELRGIKAAGKSKIMMLSSCLTFNGSNIMTNPTAATLFRETHAKRPTTYLDEAESLFRIGKGGRFEPDERVEIINSGYNQEGAVPRQEVQGKRFVTIIYRTYAPRMIASINGLYGATESRAIVHIQTRAPNQDPRGNREIDRRDPRWEKIRSDLYLLLLQSWREVLASYERVGQDADVHLKKRDMQLWRPILALARLIGKEEYKKILAFAHQLAAVGHTDELQEGGLEHRCLERMYFLLNGGQRFILIKDLQEAFPTDRQPHAKTITRILDTMGLRDFKDRRGSGVGYYVTMDEFRALVEPQYPLLIASFHSFDSPQVTLVVDNVTEKKKDDDEAKDKSVKEDEANTNSAGEANEPNEPNEGELDTNTKKCINSAKTLVHYLRMVNIPIPRDVILESVDPAVGGYDPSTPAPGFWLDTTLKMLERENKIIKVGADSWTVLE